jgi:hypothetical protein
VIVPQSQLPVFRTRIWAVFLDSGSLKPLGDCLEDEVREARNELDADYPRGDRGAELIARCKEFVGLAHPREEEIWHNQNQSESF